MKIMMVKSCHGIDREDGATTKHFVAGEEYSATELGKKRYSKVLLNLDLQMRLAGMPMFQRQK